MKTSKRVKQIYIFFISGAVLSLVHGALNFVLEKQEWFSLGLAAAAIVAAALALIYNMMEFSITQEPIDLWKAGFLGLFGLLGLIPGMGFGYFGFFALFALFGTRNYF